MSIPKTLHFIRHEHSCANQLESVFGHKYVNKGRLGLVKRVFEEEKCKK